MLSNDAEGTRQSEGAAAFALAIVAGAPCLRRQQPVGLRRRPGPITWAKRACERPPGFRRPRPIPICRYRHKRARYADLP